MACDACGKRLFWPEGVAGLATCLEPTGTAVLETVPCSSVL